MQHDSERLIRGSMVNTTHLADGDTCVVGVMVESHLVGGRQDLVPGKPLVYGQSITDACLEWDASVASLERLAKAVQARRRRSAAA
jgi:3-deoxy-7-phosphoheptulonate synthase